jgi:pyrrolidone-carboxylate peptidase
MKEERLASGKLELYYLFEEPASMQWDIYSHKLLVGDGDNVILDENSHSVDINSSSGGHTARRTSIPVKLLVKLIREHGIKLEEA